MSDKPKQAFGGMGVLSKQLADQKNIQAGASLFQKTEPVISDVIQEAPKPVEKTTRKKESFEEDRWYEIEPEKIEPWEYADRLDVEIEQNIGELIESIAYNGQDMPILVRPHPKKKDFFQEIYGRTRLEACRRLNMKVKCFIKDLTDENAFAVQTRENSKRKSLSPWSQALSYQKAMNGGLFKTHEILALRCNVSRSTVTNYLSFIKNIPENFQKEHSDVLVSMSFKALMALSKSLQDDGFGEFYLKHKTEVEGEGETPSSIEKLHAAFKRSSVAKKEIEKQPAERKFKRSHKSGDLFSVSVGADGAIKVNILKQGREVMTAEQIADVLEKAMLSVGK